MKFEELLQTTLEKAEEYQAVKKDDVRLTLELYLKNLERGGLIEVIYFRENRKNYPFFQLGLRTPWGEFLDALRGVEIVKQYTTEEDLRKFALRYRDRIKFREELLKTFIEEYKEILHIYENTLYLKLDIKGLEFFIAIAG